MMETLTQGARLDPMQRWATYNAFIRYNAR
jgi:hypothetical protein